MIFDIIYTLKKEGIDASYSQIIDTLIHGINCDFTTLEKWDEAKIKLPFLPKKMNYLNVHSINHTKRYILLGKKDDHTIATFNFLQKAYLTNIKDIVEKISKKQDYLDYNGFITCLERNNTQKLFYFNYKPTKDYLDYHKVKGIRGYVISSTTDENGNSICDGIYIIAIVAVDNTIKTATLNKYSGDALKYHNIFHHTKNGTDQFNRKYTIQSFKELDIEPIERFDIDFDGNERSIEKIFNSIHLNGVESIIKPKSDNQKLTFQYWSIR